MNIHTNLSFIDNILIYFLHNMKEIKTIEITTIIHMTKHK
jgi:hypothetical protein